MIVIKRDGHEEEFDREKIKTAILKAMSFSDKYSEKVADNITNEIEAEIVDKTSVPEIESKVFSKLIAHKHKLTAKLYEGYRAVREYQRKTNTIDNELQELLSDTSEYWNEENSNKNALLVSTKRDYIAGVVSKDIGARHIYPPDVIQADKEGIIHIHDQDYGLQHMTNCELVNLEDMLQYGTVINGVKIDKPHKLLTATTIATQIILSVTSMTYGGSTINLGHLAPFVRDSYNSYYKKYKEFGLSDEKSEELANIDLKKEIKDSVQTFNYQLNSMTNSNG